MSEETRPMTEEELKEILSTPEGRKKLADAMWCPKHDDLWGMQYLERSFCKGCKYDNEEKNFCDHKHEVNPTTTYSKDEESVVGCDSKTLEEEALSKCINKIIQHFENEGIIFHFVSKGDKYCEANGEDNYSNHCAVAGNEIWLGFYDNAEEQLAGLLHEIGHTKINNCKEMTVIDDGSKTHYPCTDRKYEKCAWQEAIKICKDFGIIFNVKMKKYMNSCLLTYKEKKEEKLMKKTVTYRIESEIDCDCDGHFRLTITINDGKHCIYDIERVRDSLADVKNMVESEIKAAKKFLDSYADMLNNNNYKRMEELKYDI